MNIFFVVFRLFVLLPNSMSKLIHNRCTCKVITKTTAAYLYAHDRGIFSHVFSYFSIVFLHYNYER